MGRTRVHDEATAAALLDAAEKIVQTEGLQALTVRRVAEKTGTTTRAVYTSLGSKQALLSRLGVRAFDMLGAMVEGLPPAGDPAADLVAAGTLGFRQFALNHPALFRIGVQQTSLPSDVAQTILPAAERAGSAASPDRAPSRRRPPRRPRGIRGGPGIPCGLRGTGRAPGWIAQSGDPPRVDTRRNKCGNQSTAVVRRVRHAVPAPAGRRIPMAQPAPPSCPVCGVEAQPVHDLVVTLADRAEHARAAAARQRAEPRPARPRGGSGSGAGGGISLDDVLLGTAAVVAGEMIRALWRKTARPLAGRVASQVERRGQEAMAAALSAAGRRPELLCCGRDQIVFLARGRRTVPASDAMSLLVRGDDTGLVAALREGA